MAGYIGTQAVSVNTTSATISDDLSVGDDLTVTDDATIGGTALVTGVLTTTAAAVFSGGFTSNGDTVTFTSANATDPLLIIQNTTNDAASARIRFVKDKGAAGADDDKIGTIEFFSDNAAQQQTQFALIRGEVAISNDGAEGGKLRLQVATHDGEMQSGLILADGNVEDEIDVQIANGTASLTTIKGNATITSDLTVTGVSLFRDGTAGAPAISNTGDTDTGMFFPAADQLAFGTGNAEGVRLDGSLRWLIGQTASTNSDGVQGRLQVGANNASASAMVHRYSANASAPQVILGKSRNATVGNHTVLQNNDICGILSFHGNDGNGFHEAASIQGKIDGTPGNNDVPGSLIFSTNAGNTGVTQRMRLNAAGEFFIGKLAEVATQDGFQFKQSGECIVGRGSNDTVFIFQDINTSGNTVGSISITNNATAYNESSDYRLKENVDYNWDATTRLKQLKPARFNFISDDTNTLVDGFLAHEVQAVVPESVFGTHNETKTLTKVVLSSSNTVLAENIEQSDWAAGKLATTDEGGNAVAAIYPSDSTWAAEHVVPKMQQFDKSKLVPLLVKTILELEARITALEG